LPYVDAARRNNQSVLAPPSLAYTVHGTCCALQVSCSANSSLRHKVEDTEQQLAALSNSLAVQHADLARFAESVGSCLAAAREDAATAAAAAAAAAPSSYLSTLLAPAGAAAAAAAAAAGNGSSGGLGSMQLPGAPAGVAAGMMSSTAAPARRQTWAAWVSVVVQLYPLEMLGMLVYSGLLVCVPRGKAASVGHHAGHLASCIASCMHLASISAESYAILLSVLLWLLLACVQDRQLCEFDDLVGRLRRRLQAQQAADTLQGCSSGTSSCGGGRLQPGTLAGAGSPVRRAVTSAGGGGKYQLPSSPGGSYGGHLLRR
jgi:hypothetical protein